MPRRRYDAETAARIGVAFKVLHLVTNTIRVMWLYRMDPDG